jgi:hypothetical protein
VNTTLDGVSLVVWDVFVLVLLCSLEAEVVVGGVHYFPWKGKMRQNRAGDRVREECSGVPSNM